MNCPTCGQELSHPYTPRCIADAIGSRLEQYGYGKGMYPKKYRAIQGIREALKVTVVGYAGCGNRTIPAGVAQEVFKELNRILPDKAYCPHGMDWDTCPDCCH